MVQGFVTQIASLVIFKGVLKLKIVHHNYQIIQKYWNMVWLKKENTKILFWFLDFIKSLFFILKLFKILL